MRSKKERRTRTTESNDMMKEQTTERTARIRQQQQQSREETSKGGNQRSEEREGTVQWKQLAANHKQQRKQKRKKERTATAHVYASKMRTARTVTQDGSLMAISASGRAVILASAAAHSALLPNGCASARFGSCGYLTTATWASCPAANGCPLNSDTRSTGYGFPYCTSHASTTLYLLPPFSLSPPNAAGALSALHDLAYLST